MPLTEQELAQVELLKRYGSKDNQEIARQIAIDRKWARELDATAAAVASILELAPSEQESAASVIESLQIEVARLTEERDAATRRVAELLRHLDEQTVEGKTLTSYQHFILGMAAKKNGEGWLPVSTIVDQLNRAGFSLSDKTVRNILKAAQDRVGSGALPTREFPD